MPWPYPLPEPRITILDDFAVEAAGLIAAELMASLRERGVAALVLSGGGTPVAVYRHLAGESFPIDWGRVHVFWGDERLVPPDDPGSNFHSAQDALLRQVPIPAGNIHRIRGELPAAEAVADYHTRLRGWAAVHDPGAPHPWPRFDLVLLGLGEDGHTASLFPGSPVAPAEPVLAVTADYQGRPAGRVTLTPLVFNDARHLMFLITGANKAPAIRAMSEVLDLERFPAQRIRPEQGQVSWLLDRAAAGLTPPA